MSTMRTFRVDTHSQPRFTRGASGPAPSLSAAWAALKGLTAVATGSVLHPRWRERLHNDLALDEASGLYQLRASLAGQKVLPGFSLAAFLERHPSPPVFFLPHAVVQCAWKHGGKTRNVRFHLYLPDFGAAASLRERLAPFGDCAVALPRLNLPPSHLLELLLETHPLSFLVPAGIWEPRSGLLGEKSGMASIAECFGDLAGEIFALEAGPGGSASLARLCGGYDEFRLMAGSGDAGARQGRAVTLFQGAVSYRGIRAALARNSPFLAASPGGEHGAEQPAVEPPTRYVGALEPFPEAGPYYLDGHRECACSLSPQEARAALGLCPCCGRPLTRGVLHRVQDLADRETPVLGPDETFTRSIPLANILAEITGAPATGRVVAGLYGKALLSLGPELDILTGAPLAGCARFLPPLAKALDRLRQGKVECTGGYDGVPGVVRLFSNAEVREITLRVAGPSRKACAAPAMQGDLPLGAHLPLAARKKRKPSQKQPLPSAAPSDEDFMFADSPDELAGTELPPSPEIPVGQGARRSRFTKGGKAVMEAAAGHSPSRAPADGITALGRAFAAQLRGEAITTLDAAQSAVALNTAAPVLVQAPSGTGKTRLIGARILHLLDEGIAAQRIVAVTHTRRAGAELDAALEEALGGDAPLPRTDTLYALGLELWHRTHGDVPVLLSVENAATVFAEANAEEPPALVREAWQALNRMRQRLEPVPEAYEALAGRYAVQKSSWNLADYTDILEFWYEQIAAGLYKSPWGHVLVDEVQELTPLELSVLRALLSSSGEGFFGVGDPLQMLDARRRAHGNPVGFFREVWPNLRVRSLGVNYRSQPEILELAHLFLPEETPYESARSLFPSGGRLRVFAAPDAAGEAAWMAERMRRLTAEGFSFGDMAVLVRIPELATSVSAALAREGLPVVEPNSGAFWNNALVGLVLRLAGRMYGINPVDGGDDTAECSLACPDKILAKGPLGMAAFLSTVPPFTPEFWNSPGFREMCKAYSAHGGWAPLLTWVALNNEMERGGTRSDKVRILQVGPAKGLSFPVVFLPCCEDGLMPFVGEEMLTGKMEKGKTLDVAEEQRWLYTCIHRAEHMVFFSHAGRRVLYGKEFRLQPSRFLRMIPADMVTRSSLVRHEVRQERQLQLF